MSIKDRVCQHLQASGLPPRESNRLAALTQKWVENSGPVWAAQRWKSLSTYAHQRLVDTAAPLPKGWAVRTNSRGKKILQDNFLHRVLELPSEPRPTFGQLRVIEAITRISSSILDNKPKQSKLLKCCESIITPSTKTRETMLTSAVEAFVDSLGEPPSIKVRETIPLKAHPVSHHSSPYWVKQNGEFMMKKMKHHEGLVVLSPTWFENTKWGRRWVHSHQREFSRCIYGVNDRYPMFLGDYNDCPETLPVGSLGFLSKDGSAKTRVIANPCMDIQACLKPLQQVLEHALHRTNASAVHDQQAGREWVREQLIQGKFCFGFDQSAFTDRFPYSIQRQLLLVMKKKGWPIRNSDIELLDHCVSSYWTANPAGIAVKYAVGQMMGLNPSFALATLTHLCVVHTLKPQKKRLEDLTRVVGDDIVISDKITALRYSEYMTKDLGVTINQGKSLNSEFITQFCGKLITPEGIIPATKIRPIETQEALAEKLTHYGVTKLQFFTKELQEFPDVLLPQPIGSGIKPANISYSNWIKKVEDKDTATKSLKSDLQDFLGSSSFNDGVAHERNMRWEDSNPTFVIDDDYSDLSEDPSFEDEEYDAKSPFEDISPNHHANLVDMAHYEDNSLTPGSFPGFNSNGYISNNERPSQVNHGRIVLGKAEDLASSINRKLSVENQILVSTPIKEKQIDPIVKEQSMTKSNLQDTTPTKDESHELERDISEYRDLALQHLKRQNREKWDRRQVQRSKQDEGPKTGETHRYSR